MAWKRLSIRAFSMSTGMPLIMSDYFSSQTTIERKVISYRVKLMADKDRDGTADTATLEQAFSSARETIVGYLTQRYGSQVDAWTFDTIPVLLKHISDDLVIFELAGGTPKVNPVIQINQEQAIAKLEKLSKYEMSLPGVADLDDDYITKTDTFDSDFEGDAESDSDDDSHDPEFFPR
jgi:phage gp36-like protein